jgi:hypothetical protein
MIFDHLILDIAALLIVGGAFFWIGLTVYRSVTARRDKCKSACSFCDGKNCGIAKPERIGGTHG